MTTAAGSAREVEAHERGAHDGHTGEVEALGRGRIEPAGSLQPGAAEARASERALAEAGQAKRCALHIGPGKVDSLEERAVEVRP